VSDLLRSLNGIFSIALWDGQAQKLLLARDAFGVKPLYYKASNNGFAFASEIKALIPLLKGCNDLKSRQFGGVNVAAINRYLSFLWCPGDDTPMQNIFSIGPGQAFWVKEGVIEESISWYKLPVFEHIEKKSIQLVKGTVSPSVMTISSAVKGTEHYLRQAVHRQMIADVPVGAFLSGGLDSSSIVAFAREVNPDIRCYTIEAAGISNEGIIDDLPYAQLAARHLKVPLDVVRIDAARMSDDLAEMVTYLDEPLADPASLNVLYISRLAREQGIKVLLSGVGGDDLFTGYRRHYAVSLENYWSWLPNSLISKLESLTTCLDQRNIFGRRFRKLFSGASLDGDARLINYFKWSKREDIQGLYTNEFKFALGEDKAEDPMIEFLANLPSGMNSLDRMLALDQRFFLTDHNLNYTDKMSMAEGVEARVPFLDLDLVKFSSRIPVHFKQRGSQGKWVLKKAMESYLPKKIIYRPKSGFGVPLRRWMRFELRDLLMDVLSFESLQNRGIFNPKAVQSLIQANDRGELDASYTLLSLICIELWCRKFID
jgi:asparagine synthase (glutamine-hydrolysing)